MTEQENYEYEGVKLVPGDVEVAFGFYVNACNSFGYAQNVMSVEEITEENLIEVLARATEAGFTLQATPQFRKFEKFLIESGANNGEPKIWVSFYGNFKNLQKYGVVPVRIAQFAPRYTKKHESYLKLAPSKEMLAEAKSGDYDPIDWRRRFDGHLETLDVHEVFDELLEIGEGRDVALLCYEKPDERCHRQYVKAWLGEAGYVVEEFPTLEFYGKGNVDTCCQQKFEFQEGEVNDE